MRYFAELAYLGSRYVGWQKQPNGLAVQARIEETLSLLLRQEIEVVGCGRTDTGVHASQYYLHFDFDGQCPPYFHSRLNKVLPPDIAIYHLYTAAPDAHARFDASRRAYTYFLHTRKSPFQPDRSWFFPQHQSLQLDQMQAAAQLLLQYDAFFPFCKTNSDAKNMRCDLSRCEWVFDTDRYEYRLHIAANRFLRGMVRLIVRMCIRVGQGKLSVEQVKRALDEQSRLKESYSAPPQGLFLSEVHYPAEKVKWQLIE